MHGARFGAGIAPSRSFDVADRLPLPAPTGSFAKHDRADFAQEFLRRNAGYRAAWEVSRCGPGGAAGTVEAHRWGLSTLFDPARSPRAAPALWRADTASQIVSLVPAPADIAGLVTLPDLAPAAEFRANGEREVVLDRAGVRHRLRLISARPNERLAILLPPLGDTLRVAACDAARRMLAGLALAEPAALLRPSALQRQRLALLLRVHDAWAGGASNREIGIAIVYPWLAGVDATAWKASGERRRVQRLLAEARHLAEFGYRALLSA